MLRPRQFIKMPIIFLASCIYAVTSLAQSRMKGITTQEAIHENISSTTISELTIGDKVPDIGFSLLNFTTKTASFSDFRGKSVILDFWATWCTTCIKSFPKMDSLQQEFKNQLQIILLNTHTTRDTEAKIVDFIDAWKVKKGKPLGLPSTVGDTIANQLFKHESIPHYVWIDKNGIVRAITSSDQITRENISNFLNEANIHLPLKKDFDSNKPLFSNNDVKLDNLTYYSIFVKGEIEGQTSINKTVRNKDIVRGRAMKNIPLLKMYEEAFTLQNSGIEYNDKRLILEVYDSLPLIFNRSEVQLDTWNKQNLYTYDLIVPTSEHKNVYDHLINGLNTYSNYIGKIEKRITKCLILVYDKTKDKRRSGEKNLFDKNFYNVKNYSSINQLLSKLNGIQSIRLPIVDETHFPGPIEIILPKKTEELFFLMKVLKLQGFDLAEVNRTLEMFVLTEKKYTIK